MDEISAAMKNHPLGSVFQDALLDVLSGKGEKFHGHGAQWEDQPINLITRMTGPEGPMFQVFKKVHEGITNHKEGTKNPDQAYRELIGALVYLASIAWNYKVQMANARQLAQMAGKEFNGYYFDEGTGHWGIRTKDREVGEDNQDEQPESGDDQGSDQ